MLPAVWVSHRPIISGATLEEKPICLNGKDVQELTLVRDTVLEINLRRRRLGEHENLYKQEVCRLWAHRVFAGHEVSVVQMGFENDATGQRIPIRLAIG